MLSLLLASAALAAPLKRQAATESAFCQTLDQACVAAVSSDLKNIWNLPVCIAYAGCYASGNGLKTLVANVNSAKNGNATAPAPASLPRLSDAAWAAISTDGATLTNQNFIDLVYRSIQQTGKNTYPSSAADVTAEYTAITAWTGPCNGPVKKSNFADFLQYQATVTSNVCQTTPPPNQNVSSEISCQTMYKNCVAVVKTDLSDFFQNPSCTFFASCSGGSRPVDDAIAIVYSAKNSAGTPPKSVNLARFPQSLYNQWTGGNGLLTQQKWIDAWYSLLKYHGGPYPTSTAPVIGYYQRLTSWTGQCTNGIPYMNTADYYQYSASVQGSGCPQTSTKTTSTSYTSTSTSTVTSATATATGFALSLAYQCEGASKGSYKAPFWNTPECLLAAPFTPTPIADLIGIITRDDYLKPYGTQPIKPIDEPRMSTDAFKSISGGKDTLSQQAFIDAVYNLLSNQKQYTGPPGAESPTGVILPATYPSDVSVVIKAFNSIQAWTGYCSRDIPASNFADWLQYFNTVAGAKTTC